MRNAWTRFASIAGVAAAGLLLTGLGPCNPHVNPIIFVHGGSGSGAQFESQAMRFTSNGYPQARIAVLEYDSSAISTILPTVIANLDALVDDLLAETGATQVDLMGHSLGTTVSQTYLSDPARAAKVAHYVNIDGQPAAAPPGGVPTLALWAGAIPRNPAPQIVGATNVTIPDQEHVEVATSEESFFEMFHFLHGHAPLTTEVLPQVRPQISGRVTSFPQNTGLDGATLEIWWVDGENGARIGSAPKATYAIGPDGNFGPFRAFFGLSYELAVTRAAGNVSVRYYYEPFIRSDSLVRLNVALGLAPFIDTSPNHSSVSVVRFQEFWGDRGAQNDVLSFNGTDVINATTARSGAVGIASSAFFVFDDGSDGVSNLNAIPVPFGPLPFLTGADLFLPSAPAGVIAVETVPRGDIDAARTVHIPNVPSTEARLVVQLRDFE